MRDWRESRRCIAFLRFYFLTTERECHFPLSPAVCMYPIRFLLCRMFHAKGPGRRLGTSRVPMTCIQKKEMCSNSRSHCLYVVYRGSQNLKTRVCGLLVARNKSSLKRQTSLRFKGIILWTLTLPRATLIHSLFKTSPKQCKTTFHPNSR